MEDKIIQIEELTLKILELNKELVHQNSEKEKRATELLMLKDSLFSKKQLLEKTLISIEDGVISTDQNKNVIFLNNIAQLISGWTQEEACGKPIYEVFNIMSEYSRKREVDIVKKVMVTGKIHLLANHTILTTKDGGEALIEVSVTPIFNETKEIIGTLIIFRDYTEKWKRLKKIEYLSYHDEMTGLYNRCFYEEELIRMDNKRNLPLSLLIGDINGLKLINDSFGHHSGDELLKKVAKTISKVCRANDIAARLGGDKFIIVLPNTRASDTEKIIERIRKYLKKYRVHGLEISISLGFGTKTEIGQDIDDIFRDTEDHMYRNKVFEDSSMRKRTIDLVTNILFEKNGREFIHSKNVSALVEALSKKMGFSDDNCNRIRVTGLMHDIGKIGIPDNILNKEGDLTLEEYNEIKKHPEIGYRILSSVNEFSEMADQVLEHHEKWDGTGYPMGLEGEEIKIEARIIAICDAFDAMTTLRTYRVVISQEDAVDEIKRCAGSQFDPDIVEIFADMIINDEKI